jgi:hypothetical protein
MSLFESALVAYLRADSGLNALINGRVHPGRLSSPGEYPALVYQRISTVRRAGYDGRMPLVEARFQFDAWADRQASARQVAQTLTDALLGFNGEMGGYTVQVPRQSNDMDMFEDDAGLYRVMTEFIIWHSEGND